MPINSDKPNRWPADTARSVQLYNDWYHRFAPSAHKQVSDAARQKVGRVFALTSGLEKLTGQTLIDHPEILPVLRMITTPPLAKARLGGFVGATSNTINKLEGGMWPPTMNDHERARTAEAIIELVRRMCDRDTIAWLDTRAGPPESSAVRLARAVIAERLAGSCAGPIIRNEQEARQLRKLERWLMVRGYQEGSTGSGGSICSLSAGTFAVRPTLSTPEGNVPVDIAIQPHEPLSSGIPLLIEAKSAGDFANTNKRRKEEGDNVVKLRTRFSQPVPYLLFLGGYFNEQYLKHVAGAGIDWVWEHRVADFEHAGL